MMFTNHSPSNYTRCAKVKQKLTYTFANPQHTWNHIYYSFNSTTHKTTESYSHEISMIYSVSLVR